MTEASSFFRQAMSRRRCIRNLIILGTGLLSGTGFTKRAKAGMQKSKVAIVRTDNRATGIRTAMAQFDLTRFRGASIALKANYNSADPFPASTHPDTLRALIKELKNNGAGQITLAERSGMGKTSVVLEKTGVTKIAREHGVRLVVMEDLGADGHISCDPEESHWKRGFLLARPFAEADLVVQTCCLKTHQYGGHFTMSLKNAVGAVAKYDPADRYNFMSELHSSPRQRSMISEISLVYRNHLIVMDALKAFVTGGPHSGREVEPGLIVVGTDPVAIDAVGVAILRMYGTTREVSKGRIFEQEQLRRAAELGIGVRSARHIELVPLDKGAKKIAASIMAQLD